MRSLALAETIAGLAFHALQALAPLKAHVPRHTFQACLSAINNARSTLTLPEVPLEWLPSQELASVSLLAEAELDEDYIFSSEPELEASRCRAFLLEIVRRAIHDWVLYRQHAGMEKRKLALNAYVWLFEEEPGHPDWEERKTAAFPLAGEADGPVGEEGVRTITGFLTICEAVGLDPETVRNRARIMTVRDVMHAGRPAERRRAARDDNVSIEEHAVWADDIDLESLGEPVGDEREYVGYTAGLRDYM